MEKYIDFERIVFKKKQYLEEILFFLKGEIEFFTRNHTSGEAFQDISEQYNLTDVRISTEKGIIATININEENNTCIINFGCNFLLYLYSIVTAYYWKHSLSKDVNDIVKYSREEILDLVDRQSPYDVDDWDQYGKKLDYRYHVIAREHIYYIVLLILYHELVHLTNNHFWLLRNSIMFSKEHIKTAIQINKFVEVDADICASFYYVRRLFSGPLSILPNGTLLNYPKEQTIYFIIGSLGLLFSLEDLLANKITHSLDYYKIEEYTRSNYLHPLVRCNVVRMQMHTTLEKLDYDEEDTYELAEIMRLHGRSLLLSMSKALGFTDERWDLHNDDQNIASYTSDTWDWYYDQKDLILREIKENHGKQFNKTSNGLENL